MKLVLGDPYWPIKDPSDHHYPLMRHDLETEVVVVGGGITSALVALAFFRAGIPAALLCDGRLGQGSTSASTALLQYEIDYDLTELADKIGREAAVRAYRLCAGAIRQIGELAGDFPADFAYRPSLYLAARERDIPALEQEFAARQAAGFAVRFLDREALRSETGLLAPAAIRSELGAQVDPYQLSRRIFAYLQSGGMPVFEQTRIDPSGRDGRTLRTWDGYPIRARHAVFASGYRSQAYLSERVVKLHSTYAFVTPPLPEAQHWAQSALWWDSADPYLYARTTVDRRLMIGGGDRFFHSAWLRRRVHARQVESIRAKARRYFPAWQGEIAYSWNGVFGETGDGLAYIGTPKEWKHADFALGFGGNGITYSQLAADLLVRKYRGEEPKDLALFRFGR